MKQHILNFILVLIIAIGGVLLVQPPTTQAQEKFPCTVEAGEDPCTVCFGEDCQEGSLGCGILVSEDGEWVDCEKVPE